MCELLQSAGESGQVSTEQPGADISMCHCAVGRRYRHRSDAA